MPCPACSSPMVQLARRHFVCTPCRQSIQTFDVAAHQYLPGARHAASAVRVHLNAGAG